MHDDSPSSNIRPCCPCDCSFGDCNIRLAPESRIRSVPGVVDILTGPESINLRRLEVNSPGVSSVGVDRKESCAKWCLSSFELPVGVFGNVGDAFGDTNDLPLLLFLGVAAELLGVFGDNTERPKFSLSFNSPDMVYRRNLFGLD